MINKVVDIAKKAGEKILEIYCSDNFDIEIKEDNSPLTRADLESNEIIFKELNKLYNYPILSEEKIIDYEIRKNWNKFWLIDPLDGTKDFIAKNDQFTVNIALIKNSEPILGVIYVPAKKIVYYAQKNKGAYKNGQKIFNNSKRKELIASDSVFHSTTETMDFLAINNITEIKRFGSAYKLGKLAEGELDIYPRFNGTKEWDTAAGQIILEEANCKIIDLKTKKTLCYNKESIKNNFFIALRKDLEINYENYRISCGAGDKTETFNR